MGAPPCFRYQARWLATCSPTRTTGGSLPCSTGWGKQERSPRLLSRAYLYTQLESFYVPVRKKGVRRLGNTFEEGTGNPPAQPGNITTLLATMEAGNLIRQEPSPEKSRREKVLPDNTRGRARAAAR